MVGDLQLNEWKPSECQLCVKHGGPVVSSEFSVNRQSEFKNPDCTTKSRNESSGLR